MRAAFPSVPVVPVLAEPRVSSAQASQALYGHLLVVLASEGDWRRVRTGRDGYEGWAHAGYLEEFDPPDFARDVAEHPDVFGAYAERTWGGPGRDGPAADAPAAAPAEPRPLVSLDCVVEHRGRRLRLPLGAVVHAGGTAVAVLAGEAVAAGDPTHFAEGAAAVVATARRYFESTSYQWGGLTPWGADCSGLVQSVYALHGADLPRDAWQQAAVGADAGLDLRAHRPGDLLFFSERPDGRVTHVGLATGDGAMCHLALGRGGWAVDALAEPEDAYAERLAGQLVAARRVL
jgi:cell wall-associated NlpC family hydrolase